MAGTMRVHIRTMKQDDYDQVYDLWMRIKGFGIRSVDDSREGVSRFIKRNPTTSVVAVQNGRIIGSILCGHDGRRGCFYHVCVAPDCRQRGIGEELVMHALRALREEGISKVNLIAFRNNAAGNTFWQNIGWQHREDVNYYEMNMNEKNITSFID